jgi:site-specific DNA recombinase
MPSTNGSFAGSKTAILYARVSTDEQARSGYSLRQQIERLRECVAHEGYEVLEEVIDPGQSGASLQRPGLDRVRDLVASSGVSVVLAQDRDRFAREPAYLYLLKQEFGEHGTIIRALNDRGDDTPEGELQDGILDQLAKFERAKTAERTRRGKLRKAREGKVLAGTRPNYGFLYNATRDNYTVDEESMRIIGRIFRMVGAEGQTLNAVKRTFNHEGVRPPLGGKYWSPKYIRECIKDDVYRPHTFEEIAQVVTPEVAARLDPSLDYGIWWFNRRRTETKQVSEMGPEGRQYRRRIKVTDKPRSEWIAVPVPDSGIPREWVDATREAIKNNKRPSANADRVWELSGGMLFCKECGNRMSVHTTVEHWKGKVRRHYYYRCPKRQRHGSEACSHKKNYRATDVESRVWEFVAELLQDPERLRAGLEEMIEQERAGSRGDPEREITMWFEKAAEVDSKRSAYQEQQAEGLITLDELRVKLTGLEETRRAAETEIDTLRSRIERVEDLERNRDTLLGSYADLIPQKLQELGPEKRQQIYNMLRLKLTINPDGDMEATGVIIEESILCENGLTCRFTTWSRSTALGRPKRASYSRRLSLGNVSDRFATLDGP